MESEGVADLDKTDGDTIHCIRGWRRGGFRYRGYEHDTNDGDPLSGFGREGIGGVQISGARDR